MKKIIIAISILFTSYSIAQTTNKLNNNDIENLKKEYFQYLRTNHDARVFSINKQRKTFVYKRLSAKQDASAENFTKDSIIRDIKRKNFLYDQKIKKLNHAQSIANTIEYRKGLSTFDRQFKKEKKDRLEKTNNEEIATRNQSKKTKIKQQKKQLETKIETRHELLKKRYAIPLKEKS